MTSFSYLKLKVSFVILWICFISCVNSKNQYVTPLNMGMKVSVPYDIANILHRPNPFQGGLAITLSFGLLSLIFFGVILSPFGYIFGIPSQKYVLGDLKTVYEQQAGAEAAEAAAASRVSDFESEFENLEFEYIDEAGAPRSFLGSDEALSKLNEVWTNVSSKLDLNLTKFHEFSSVLNVNEQTVKDAAWKLFLVLSKRNLNRSFLKSMFYWMPESDSAMMSESCQLLTLCYAHGTMKLMPTWMILVYRVFSNKMMTLPKPHKDAILLGFAEESENNCPAVYAEGCPENLFTLVLKSFLNVMPDFALSPSVKKRKQAMYM